MFRKMPVLLGVLILSIFCLHEWIPLPIKELLYGLSLSIKAVIIFLIPVLIFALLFKTAAQLARTATKVFLLILLGVCCSNFLSTMLSYGVGRCAYHVDLSIAIPQDSQGLTAAWTLILPKWLSNDRAMCAGLLLGVLLGLVRPVWAEKLASVFEVWVNRLMKVLLYLIPFFLGGFVIKLCHDRVLANIINDYAGIFALVAVAQFAYVGFLYVVGSGFSLKGGWLRLKNMFPAALAGFGSMSSAAAMPLTLLGVEKNVSEPAIARATIPATVNIHLIGDCFAIPIFAFAVLKNFGAVEPTLISYLIFALYFVMAKFSVAAVPGGGILVMLPILESQLGFTPEMMSLITALYILFDPLITAANILGNGAFAVLFSRGSVAFSKRSVNVVD